MSGTAQSISGLYTTWSDSGPAGRDTPATVRNLVATVAARTGAGGYGTYVRVTDPEFGADPTGATDSTTAFQNAMAAGPCIVPAFQTNGTSRAIYTVSNCIVPSGAVLVGDSGPGYVGGGLSSDGTKRPLIQGPNNAFRLFNVFNAKNVLFRGLYLTGVQSTTPNTCDGFSSGGESVQIQDCLIAFMNRGLGGSPGGTGPNFPNGTWDGMVFNTRFQQCATGIDSMTDSWVVASFFSECNNGLIINGTNGSSTNNLIGNRYEWCGKTSTGGNTGGWATGGYGLQFINSGGSTNVIGGQFDANGEAGILMAGFDVTVSGTSFSRNGTNCTTALGKTLVSGSSHIKVSSAFNFYVNGIDTRVISDGNVFAPLAAFNFVGTQTANGSIIVQGSNLSGYQGQTDGSALHGPNTSSTLWFTGTLPNAASQGTNALVVKNNIGTGTAAQDVDTR